MELATIETALAVRRLVDLDDYVAAEKLQEQVWGIGDLGRSSLVDMRTAHECGGIVIGAFERDDLVGFVYSMLGITRWGQLKQASVLLGVLPDHRGRGIGRRLKLAQRDAARDQGIGLITWTFDPLIAVNAELNVAKLGAGSNDYLVNYYGADAGGLNAGLPTDRLLVEWRVDVDEIPPLAAPESDTPPGRQLLRYGIDQPTGLPTIESIEQGATDPRVLLPIPHDIDTLKRRDRQRAMEWRLATRAIFTDLFAQGYRVTDFRPSRNPFRLPCYVVERTSC